MTSDDYLLNRHETTDIYEVNYIFQETLADKISSVIHGVSMKLINRFLSTSYYK